MAVIALEGMRFFAYHGVHAEEKEKGNSFLVDVYLETNIQQAGKEDALEKTIDYAKVYALVKVCMEGNVDLLESLVLKINESVLAEFESLEKVKTRVSKLDPPLDGEVSRTFVEDRLIR